MTSEQTDVMIKDYLKEKKYFGLSQKQIFYMKQKSVPAFSNKSAHFCWEDKENVILDWKPCGHGEAHVLMHSSGYTKMLKKNGIKWIVTANDTNPLTFRFLAAALGIAEKQKIDYGYICVPRKPGEKVGALAKLVNQKTNKKFVCNVEYNIFSDFVKNEPVDAKGYSVYPGNTNIMLIRVDKYADTLEITGGKMPSFLNIKYDSKGNMKPTRLEMLCPEYPKYSLRDDVPDMNVGII